MSHRNFQRLMTDMEIFVDGIASMQIDSLNNFMGTARETVQAQYHKDKSSMSVFAAMEDFQKNVQSVIDGKGSREEQAAKAYLTSFGIDYDSLTPEEFVMLIGILQKSKLAENSISQRGRKRPAPQKKHKK